MQITYSHTSSNTPGDLSKLENIIFSRIPSVPNAILEMNLFQMRKLFGFESSSESKMRKNLARTQK